MKTNTLAFTFGRFQPPSEGHIKHFRFMQEMETNYHAGNAVDICICISKTQDNVNNPVSWEDRLHYIKKALPTLPCGPADDMFKVIESAGESGRYARLRYVVGQDYFLDPQGVSMIERMKKHAIKHGMELEAACSGFRVERISGTELRDAARYQDFPRFMAASPLGVGNLDVKDVRQMFELVQHGLK